MSLLIYSLANFLSSVLQMHYRNWDILQDTVLRLTTMPESKMRNKKFTHLRFYVWVVVRPGVQTTSDANHWVPVSASKKGRKKVSKLMCWDKLKECSNQLQSGVVASAVELKWSKAQFRLSTWAGQLCKCNKHLIRNYSHFWGLFELNALPIHPLPVAVSASLCERWSLFPTPLRHTPADSDGGFQGLFSSLARKGIAKLEMGKC